jgi:carboxyl-terminal processing protease
MRRPRSALAHVLAAVLLLFAYSVGFQSTSRSQEGTSQERAQGVLAETPWDKQSLDVAKLYDTVVETVEREFFDQGLLKRLDWRERAKAVRPSVVSAASAEDAVRQINALLAELKTSHTGLFTPDDYEYYVLPDILGSGRNLTELMSRHFWGSGPYYPGIGAFTRQLDARHFVDGVLEGSPAERAGLKYGDEILSVDRMPYSPIAVFRGKIGTTIELNIRRGENAEPQSLKVAVVPLRPTAAFAAATAASARIIEQNGNRVGYVHIWSSNESNTFRAALDKFEPQNIVQERLHMRGISVITNTMTDEVREMLKPPKPLDSLIVDMRGRVGGNIAVAKQYLELLDPKSYWGDWQTTGPRGQFGPARPHNPPFRGRSALLIDHHTRSAAEIMAHGYKRSAFGPLIGTPTAGAVTSGVLFVMPGDLLLYVAVAGHAFDQQPLEGVGVTPDHRVERPLSYAGGADPVLDAAVDLLVQRTQ